MSLIYLNRLFLFFIYFTNFPALSNDKEIIIFDVGQGNCILVKHKNQAILVDAGSKELSFSALYDQLFSRDKPHYRVLEKQNNSKANNNSKNKGNNDIWAANDSEEEEIQSDTELGDEVDSETSSLISPLSDDVDTEQHLGRKLRDQYEKYIISQIREKMPHSEDGHRMILKTVVISHPDEDHYNLLTKIFPSNVNFEINTIILGGFYNQYNALTQQWLLQHYYNDDKTGKIKKVIFTGTKKGTNNSDNQEEFYGRAYCSLFDSWTNKEEEIETSLMFDGSGQKPAFEILAMNAGHVEISDSGNVYIANNDKNTNSLVLRVKGTKKSFLIPGDANECTWNFIKAHYKEKLKTDYLLLSHHGSSEDGATREDILKLIQPKACFISTGRHARFHHPRKEVIETLVDVGSLESFTEEYPVSYYRKEGENILRKRKGYKQMISSTLDEGILTFDLATTFHEVINERDRSIASSIKEKDILFKKGKTFSTFKIDENYNDLKKKKKNIKKKHKKYMVIFFTRHSKKYNLIIPENGKEIDITKMNMKKTKFYLIDFKDLSIMEITQEKDT